MAMTNRALENAVLAHNRWIFLNVSDFADAYVHVRKSINWSLYLKSLRHALHKVSKYTFKHFVGSLFIFLVRKSRNSILSPHQDNE